MACLGWFVHAFASTEAMLFRLLVQKIGLTQSTGAAVLSGIRMKSAMDALNKFFESQGMALEKEALARPFKHLGEISAIRDDILHYGTEEDDQGALFVTNAEKKHLPERSTTRSVTATDLVSMTFDLRDIEVHFVASMFRTAKPPNTKMVALYTRRLAEPWQYKPPPQRPPPGAKSRPRQARKPPRQS